MIDVAISTHAKQKKLHIITGIVSIMDMVFNFSCSIQEDNIHEYGLNIIDTIQKKYDSFKIYQSSNSIEGNPMKPSNVTKTKLLLEYRDGHLFCINEIEAIIMLIGIHIEDAIVFSVKSKINNDEVCTISGCRVLEFKPRN